ncbi:beta-ketoacyl-ACP synthase III [Pararhizobium sp. IMCC21322]|uniref:beta-ketoacyl-ACP synthase III n=1 Tax=Pararhizobium sp. IMCC21322 TaxID=3067903 RepID=UPI002740416D|nr:beta-ketoacyl-ACP synthase III [Pararhizobium sp. IMCC21322]
MLKQRAVVAGVGSYLPEKVMTNDDLSKIVDTTSEWIVQRTGIERRHIAAEDQNTSDLATIAANRALEDAGVSAQDIDLIIVATSTPDNTFPATAVAVQHNLGNQTGYAFDVQAVCSGFVYAMTIADSFIRAGNAETILVIGAETFSRLLDWTDRTTCVLFGDGAGAVVMRAQPVADGEPEQGILSCHLRSDGSHKQKLYVDGGPSSTQTTGQLRMQGREVFKHAVGMISGVVTDAFAASGTTADDLTWFIPHQANKRIIEASAEKLGIDINKVVMTVEGHGNTSAASIPLALDVAVKDGRVQRGDLVMLEAMGGGFTWGSVLLRW